MVAKPLSIDEQENAVVRSEPGKISFLFLLLLLFIFPENTVEWFSRFFLVGSIFIYHDAGLSYLCFVLVTPVKDNILKPHKILGSVEEYLMEAAKSGNTVPIYDEPIRDEGTRLTDKACAKGRSRSLKMGVSTFISQHNYFFLHVCWIIYWYIYQRLNPRS